MILELGAAALLAAGAALYHRRRRARGTSTPAGGARPPSPEGRALDVGDVLLLDGDELWLAGALALRELGPVATLFPTPGAKSGWVASLGPEGRELAILSSSERIEPGPVPDELRLEGHRLSLERRGTASVEARGEHLPAAGPRARYAVLGSAAGRVAVVVDFEGGERLALLGRRVDPARVERL